MSDCDDREEREPRGVAWWMRFLVALAIGWGFLLVGVAALVFWFLERGIWWNT